MKKLFSVLVLLSILLIAQPTIDGTITDGDYTTIGTFTSGRDGWGATNNIGTLKYYQDGTDFYVGVTCDLDGNNNVVVFFNFSGYGGRGSNTLAGSSTSSIGVFTTSTGGLDGAKMDFDVDFAFAFNEGGGSSVLHLDACRFGSGAGGYLSTGYIGATDDQSGTSKSLDPTGVTGGSGSMSLAYHNGGSSSSKGIEFKIPIAAFSGVTNAQTVQFFVLITNSSGESSNECIPGDPGSSNLGFDADFSAISGQDFFTSTQSLPVELTSFSASTISNQVRLNWQTATEVNNYGFEIERKHSSNNFWKNLGFVDGNGNSNSPKYYSFTDNVESTVGKYYYRLKQIDNDGKFEYSSVVTVNFSAPNKFELAQNYPNPFNPSTVISYSIPEDGFVKLSLFNIIGQKVKVMKEGFQSAGSYSFEFNAEGLNSGLYFYKLESNGYTQVRKMLLQK